MSEARSVYREAFQHFAKGELDDAIAGYQRAIELDANLAIAWNGLSMALAQQGNVDEAIDAAREAARLIGLEADIHLLPSGYDTRLAEGITEELPADMLQRIVIARALSTKPKILLFDEGNTSLDTRSDALLRQGLEKVRENTTIFLVSLRPSLLRMADKVYALQCGQLYEVSAEYSQPVARAEDAVQEVS